jgi:hypothetical protein
MEMTHVVIDQRKTKPNIKMMSSNAVDGVEQEELMFDGAIKLKRLQHGVFVIYTFTFNPDAENLRDLVYAVIKADRVAFGTCTGSHHSVTTAMVDACVEGKDFCTTVQFPRSSSYRLYDQKLRESIASSLSQ